MKRIKFHTSPIHKFKLLFLAAHKIFDEIDKFYIKFNLPKPVEITSEDFIQIVIYVMAISQQYTLFTDIRFIEEFLSALTLNSCKGYYLITAQAALDYILQKDEEEEETKGKDEL